MKKLMICLSSLAFVSMLQAQEVVDLKAVAIETPGSMQLDETTDLLSVIVPEKQLGEFSSNPLKFAISHFNVQQLIKDNKGKYTEYIITFKTKNGRLIVNYDEKGAIKTTHQNFKNMSVPSEMAHTIYKDKDHEGWVFVGNRYIAHSRNGVVTKEFYKINLQKGNDRKTLKLNLNNSQSQLGLVQR